MTWPMTWIPAPLRAGAVAALLALAAGPALPASVPVGDDGLHKPDWLKTSFKDLPADAAEAAASGRHLMLMVEQRGCIYCAKMHEEVLTDLRIDKLIRERFDVIQIDMFGGTEITDTDGEQLTEKRASAKWAVAVTPTLIVLPAAPAADKDAARGAMAVVPGLLDATDMLALLDWVEAGGPDSGRTLKQALDP